MAAVWDSDLPSDEKFVALALADFADDAGTSIHPSQAYIAWKVGKSDRAVRDSLVRLIERGIFEKVSGEGGGRGVVVHYLMRADRLPVRESWETRKILPGSANPEVDDVIPGSLRPETRKPTSDDPSVIHHPDPPLQDHAREAAQIEGTRAALERFTTIEERLQAITDALLTFFGRRGTPRQRERIKSLLRFTGALTEQDIHHAISITLDAERDDPIAFWIACARTCVERRRKGLDPYESGYRGDEARSQGDGRSVRGGSAGTRPGAGRGNDRQHDRGRGTAAHVAVREPDRPTAAAIAASSRLADGA